MGKRQRRRLRAGAPQDRPEQQDAAGTPVVTVTAGLASGAAAVNPAGEPDKDED